MGSRQTILTLSEIVQVMTYGMLLMLRARSTLNWQPKYTDFDEGLQHTIAWYRQNKAWWQKDKANVEANYAKNKQ